MKTNSNEYPTVSVVMTTYNGAKYLRPQLDSIVGQDYPVYELIVQDDGSTDETVGILRQYEAKFPFVHVYINKENLGFTENFRTACLRATGQFVALSDQDDVWYPQKLRRQVAAIGEADICCSWHTAGEKMDGAALSRRTISPEAQLFQGILGHTMLLRRRFVQDAAHWFGPLPYDIGLGLCAHLGRGVACVEEPLNWHRMHPRSYTQTFRPAAKGRRPTWQPYVFGLVNYYRMQRKPNFRPFYQRVREAARGKNALVYELCTLLLSRSPFALFRLCRLCMKHRETIYPTPHATALRGFCFPFIHAYHCTFYV